MNGMHTFMFFSEDCLSVSSFEMYTTPKTDPISTEWLLHELKLASPEQRKTYVQEPLGLILAIVAKLLKQASYLR